MTVEPQEIDASVPHPARVYDYFLGGTDNFEADQLAAEAAIKAFPKTAESARAARAYLRRVVRYLVAEAGIRQFLDIGSGLPSGQTSTRSLSPSRRTPGSSTWTMTRSCKRTPSPC